MKKIEKRRYFEDRKVRFTNFVDEESLMFEAEAGNLMEKAAVEQTLGSVRSLDRNFFLMQMRGKDGTPAMQTCVHIGRPRLFSGFSMATVPKLWRARSSEDEELGLRALREFCSEISSILSLRVQPQRFEPLGLMDFQAHGLRQGYRVSSPISTVRTRILDLASTVEEQTAMLSSKTRSALRHSGRQNVELRAITDRRYIEACRTAETAARARSGSPQSSYDFQTTFALAASNPNRVRIVGLFLKHRPDELLAYVIGFCRGDLLEYSSAGSFSDGELRALPFNYFLLWELMGWGRSLGCSHMDMGGVTDGGPTDPLRGVTRFKRSFPGREVETGREMVVVLKPVRFLVYRTLKALERSGLRAFRRSKSWMKSLHDVISGKSASELGLVTHD